MPSDSFTFGIFKNIYKEIFFNTYYYFKSLLNEFRKSMPVKENFRKVFAIIQNKKISKKIDFIRFIGRLKMYAKNSILTTLGVVRPRKRYDAFLDKLYIYESSQKGEFILTKKGFGKKVQPKSFRFAKNIV